MLTKLMATTLALNCISLTIKTDDYSVPLLKITLYLPAMKMDMKKDWSCLMGRNNNPGETCCDSVIPRFLCPGVEAAHMDSVSKRVSL